MMPSELEILEKAIHTAAKRITEAAEQQKQIASRDDVLHAFQDMRFKSIEVYAKPIHVGTVRFLIVKLFWHFYLVSHYGRHHKHLAPEFVVFDPRIADLFENVRSAYVKPILEGMEDGMVYESAKCQKHTK